jgi:hypothetical protein
MKELFYRNKVTQTEIVGTPHGPKSALADFFENEILIIDQHLTVSCTCCWFRYFSHSFRFETAYIKKILKFIANSDNTTVLFIADNALFVNT